MPSITGLRVVPPEENQKNLEGWPQVEVFEGNYRPTILASMLEFATNELLHMVYLRARDVIGDLDSYNCEPGDLKHRGQSAAHWPNSRIMTAHNVKLRAIPISSCFRGVAREWVACDPCTTLKSGQKGSMAGPRYHRYLKPLTRNIDVTQGAANLRGNHFSITVEGRAQGTGLYHRLHLSQQHASESLTNAQGPPESAFWTGHHWQLDEYHNVFLTIINFDFTLAAISGSQPQFVPVACDSV